MRQFLRGERGRRFVIDQELILRSRQSGDLQFIATQLLQQWNQFRNRVTLRVDRHGQRLVLACEANNSLGGFRIGNLTSGCRNDLARGAIQLRA